MDWTTFGNGTGAHRSSVVGDKHDQPTLAQRDQQQNLHIEESNPDTNSADEKTLDLPHADAASVS